MVRVRVIKPLLWRQPRAARMQGMSRVAWAGCLLPGGIYWSLTKRLSERVGAGSLGMTFDVVYRQHLHAVLRAAHRVVGRRDVAEEITADAFLELHRQFDRIDAERLPGWLITVVRNRAIDYWRRQDLERRFVAAAIETATEADEPDFDRESLFGHPSLKPIHRACLLLRYEYGLTREEIAARLGLTDTQVRGHLQYGLALLRKHVSRTA